MALKRKITKEEFDALPDVLKAEYKGDGAGYVLDTEADDDTSALKNALQREKEERARLAEEARTLREANAERLRTEEQRIRDGIMAGGNVTEIRAALEQEREQLRTELTGTIGNKDKIIAKLLVDDKAQALASQLAGERAALLLPHIRSRLSADFTGDEPRCVVIAENGGPSTLSIEDLKKEFLNNKLFATILVGVNSSGGATDRTGGGGAPKKPQDYTAQERNELFRTNREEFDRLFSPK